MVRVDENRFRDESLEMRGLSSLPKANKKMRYNIWKLCMVTLFWGTREEIANGILGCHFQFYFQPW